MPLGPNGAIDLYTHAGTHLIVDLAGYWRAGSLPVTEGRYRSNPLSTRITDTRFSAAAKPAPRSTITVAIAGHHGVPTDATAVVVNLTGTEATADGYVTAYPSGTTRPTASNLNLLTGQTAPNAVIVAPGPDGTVDLYTQGGTHLIVDLAGWFRS